MKSQKVENLLNLALDATEEEREKSLELDVGYYPIDREWDVIVKYSGSLERARAIAVQVTELLNEAVENNTTQLENYKTMLACKILEAFVEIGRSYVSTETVAMWRSSPAPIGIYRKC